MLKITTFHRKILILLKTIYLAIGVVAAKSRDRLFPIDVAEL